MECNTYGDGIVVGVTGATFDDVIAEIAFKAENKKFSLKHIILNTKFVTFIDSDLLDIYNKAFEVHTEFKNTYLKLRETKRVNMIEAEKKAEAENKADTIVKQAVLDGRTQTHELKINAEKEIKKHKGKNCICSLETVLPAGLR